MTIQRAIAYMKCLKQVLRWGSISSATTASRWLRQRGQRGGGRVVGSRVTTQKYQEGMEEQKPVVDVPVNAEQTKIESG